MDGCISAVSVPPPSDGPRRRRPMFDSPGYGAISGAWWGGPLVRGRRPRRPAGALPGADVVVPAAGRGRPGPEGTPTWGSAPQEPRSEHRPVNVLTSSRPVSVRSAGSD